MGYLELFRRMTASVTGRRRRSQRRNVFCAHLLLLLQSLLLTPTAPGRFPARQRLPRPCRPLWPTNRRSPILRHDSRNSATMQRKARPRPQTHCEPDQGRQPLGGADPDICAVHQAKSRRIGPRPGCLSSGPSGPSVMQSEQRRQSQKQHCPAAAHSHAPAGGIGRRGQVPQQQGDGARRRPSSASW